MCVADAISENPEGAISGDSCVRLNENPTHMKHSASIAATMPQGQDLPLCDFAKKDQKWDKHRGDTQSIGEVYALDGKYARLSSRLSLCANILEFGELCDKDTGELSLKLQNALFCKVRTCPVCSWRRAMRNVARFFERIPTVLDAYPKHAWLFLTLTVKNPDMCDLRSTLAAMNKAFQRMQQRKDFPAAGYIRTTEITKGKDGTPHPHFHCLLLVKPGYFQGGVYLSQEAWADMWRECLRIEYQPVVDIRRVKAESDKAKAAELLEGKIAGLKAAVLETLKYSIKVEDMLSDAQFLYGVTDQLRGLRFLATGGILKDFLKDEVADDEMVNTGSEDEPTATPADTPIVLFSWRTNDRKYRKVNKT